MLLMLICYASIPGLASQIVFHGYLSLDFPGLTTEIFCSPAHPPALPTLDAVEGPADALPDFARTLLPAASHRLLELKPRNGARLTAALVLPYIRPIGARLPRPDVFNMLVDLSKEPDVAVMFLSGGFLLLFALGGALGKSTPARPPYTVPPVPGRPEKKPVPPLLPSLTRAPF